MLVKSEAINKDPPRARNEIPKAVRNFIPSERGSNSKGEPAQNYSRCLGEAEIMIPSGTKLLIPLGAGSVSF